MKISADKNYLSEIDEILSHEAECRTAYSEVEPRGGENPWAEIEPIKY
jgi:hypothetical protein